MFDIKLAMYLAAFVFSTGIAVAEFRRLKKDFDKHEEELEKKVEALQEGKATKGDVEKLRSESERDLNGIGKKVAGFEQTIDELDDREDRRFRELALILGRITDDPAIQGAIQHMASRNGGD